MGKPQAPTPPDPGETAAAQTGTNIGTSLANTQLGQVNQVGPGGSLTYDQTGTYDWTDPQSGQVYQLPQTTATTSLSETGQNIYDQNQAAQLGLASTANQQASFLQDYLGEPANFDTSAVEGRLDELARQRMDPRFERERAGLENRLTQQGVAPGSEAWNAQMGQFGETQNDAYNQLMLQGRGQAMDELAGMRNQPINEITALLSGSQVSQPNYAQARPAQIPTVDYAGLVSNNFNQQMQGYNARLNANPWGSLFGAAGNIGAATIMASDIRLKKDISHIGVNEGLNVYEYRYLWDDDDTTRRGYMAQEILGVNPEAVIQMGDGYLALDYGKLPRIL